MNIIEEQYNWASALSTRTETNYIVLHHAAASGIGPQDIHRMHLNNGWAGIGYNFFVSKDGAVYRGRPLEAVGAQCYGYNSQSVGICAEGNFEVETMPEAQKNAIADLLQEVLASYPVRVVGHRDLNATACPGANYPFDEIVALANSAPVAADPNAIKVNVRGQVMDGHITGDTGYGPIHAMCDALGLAMRWDEATKTVIIE